MPFSESEHTADILMHVTACTEEELFCESARALFSIITAGGDYQSRMHKSFTISGHDHDSLLHGFLSEILFITEVEGIVPSMVEVIFTRDGLSATIYGEGFDPEKHHGGTEVKGISFSGLQIVQNNQLYEVDILFDV